MQLICPIVIAAIIIGLAAPRTTGRLWALMVLVIVGSITRFWMKH